MISAEFVDAEFQPSLHYCLAVLGVALLASFALWHSPLDVLLKLALTLALILSSAEACWRWGLRRGRTAVVSISGGPDALTARLGDGQQVSATLRDPVLVTSFCVLFTVHLAGVESWRVPVFRDSMSPDAFRRLRVFLRLASRSAAE